MLTKHNHRHLTGAQNHQRYKLQVVRLDVFGFTVDHASHGRRCYLGRRPIVTKFALKGPVAQLCVSVVRHRYTMVKTLRHWTFPERAERQRGLDGCNIIEHSIVPYLAALLFNSCSQAERRAEHTSGFSKSSRQTLVFRSFGFFQQVQRHGLVSVYQEKKQKR